MKKISRLQFHQFAAQVSLVSMVMALLVFSLLRIIFHDFPFSLQEDAMLLLKILAASFAVCFSVGAFIHAMLLAAVKLHTIFSVFIAGRKFAFPRVSFKRFAPIAE